MKKESVMTAAFLIFTLFGITSVSAICSLNTTLLNQDPYPAVPGDYVDLVFQVKGIDSPDCSDITFNLLADYPIEFNPGESGLKTFKKVEYIKDFETNLLIPYKVRINKDALDGSNPIEVRFQSKYDSPISRTFNIQVTDVRADFEIYVKNYNYATNEMTLEVLNIASVDVQALTIEIPKQENIEVKGAGRVVVGDLDSNEYTTADFETIPQNGEFKVNLIYSDTINTRRTIEKTISFDSSYFANRKADQKTTSIGTYVIILLIVVLIIYFVYKKFKKKRKK